VEKVKFTLIIIHKLVYLLQMLLKWLLFSLCIMPAMFSNTRRKCPVECSCSIDDFDRYQAVCTKGKWQKIVRKSKGEKFVLYIKLTLKLS